MSQLGFAGKLFQDSVDGSILNTVIGASLGIIASAMIHKMTKDPFLVGVAALVGVAGAYFGSCLDLEDEQILNIRRYWQMANAARQAFRVEQMW